MRLTYFRSSIPRFFSSPKQARLLRERLTPLQWEVTQEGGTERPFANKYYDHWKAGFYHCICCDAMLFRYAM